MKVSYDVFIVKPPEEPPYTLNYPSFQILSLLCFSIKSFKIMFLQGSIGSRMGIDFSLLLVYGAFV